MTGFRGQDIESDSALAEGEQLLRELPLRNGGRFRLTTLRVLIEGPQRSEPLWAFAFLPNVVSVQLRPRQRDRRSLFWGLLGLIAAAGVWQVATNDTVGLVGGIVVALFSLALLGEFALRPPDLQLELSTGASALGETVDRDEAADAREFIRVFVEARAEAGRKRDKAPSMAQRLPRFPLA